MASGHSVTQSAESRGKAPGRFALFVLFETLLKQAIPDILITLQLLLMHSVGNVAWMSASEEHVVRGNPRIRQKFSSLLQVLLVRVFSYLIYIDKWNCNRSQVLFSHVGLSVWYSIVVLWCSIEFCLHFCTYWLKAYTVNYSRLKCSQHSA